MSEPLIPGGYILISKKIIESEIWDKPPLYLKVWVYLLTRAQYKNYKGLERGQLRTSIPELIEACSWKVGARTERPTKDQVFQVLKWLRTPSENDLYESNAKATRKATAITTTKATHGILVNIDNYWLYQDSKNYESNDEGNAESNVENPTNPDNINKELKNNKSKDIYTVFEHWNSKGIIKHKKPNAKMISHVNARLEDYSVEDLNQAIDNYKEILDSDQYYWSHKWTLQEFMKPNNVVRFLTESDPHKSFFNKTQLKAVGSKRQIDWEGFNLE